MNDEKDLIEFDDNEAISFIHNTLTDEQKQRIDDDTIQYVLDLIYETSEKLYLKEGIFFVALLGSFITGAIISTYLIQFYVLRTIWIVAVILFAFMMFRLTQYVRRSR